MKAKQIRRAWYIGLGQMRTLSMDDGIAQSDELCYRASSPFNNRQSMLRMLGYVVRMNSGVRLSRHCYQRRFVYALSRDHIRIEPL